MTIFLRDLRYLNKSLFYTEIETHFFSKINTNEAHIELDELSVCFQLQKILYL